MVRVTYNVLVCDSSGNSANKMVRLRGRLQRHGDGTAGTVAGRLVQFLLEEVFTENGATPSGPVDITYRLHPFEELHPQGHKTGQLSNGAGEEGQFGVHH